MPIDAVLTPDGYVVNPIVDTSKYQQKGIFLPKGWNDTFKSKLALSSTQLVKVALPGDSIECGQFASNLDTKSFAGLLRTSLQSKYGNGGSGFKSSYESPAGFSDATYTNSVAASSLIAASSGWSYVTTVPDGPAGNVLLTNTNGAQAIYTVNGSIVDIYMLEGTSATLGTYNVTIDGVDKGNFTTGSKAANTIQVNSFTGLSAGDHVVALTSTSTNGLFFVGMRGRNPTGIIVDKYSRGGYPSAAFNNKVGDTFTNSSGVAIGGANRGTYGPAGQWSGGSKNPADLVIYSPALNDSRPAGATTTPDSFLANARDFFDDIKQNSDASILWIMNHQGSLAFQEASTKYFALYCERARDMAEHYGIGFINLNPIGQNSYKFLQDNQYLGSKNPAGSYNAAEPVHLSDAGFQWRFNVISPWITA